MDEPPAGLEPATYGLQNRCSAIELGRRSGIRAYFINSGWKLKAMILCQPQSYKFSGQLIYILPIPVLAKSYGYHGYSNNMPFNLIDNSISLSDCPKASKAGKIAPKRFTLFFRLGL